MTVLERIVKKGYNPFNTESVSEDNYTVVRDKTTKKVIVIYKWSEDGTKHIFIK